jgi:hypothetical protein
LAAFLILVASSGSASAATGQTITNAAYDPATKSLSLQWSLPTLATCQLSGAVCRNLDLVGQSLYAGTSPNTVGGKLFPSTLIWASNDQTRFATALSGPLSTWSPGTYYLQLKAIGVEDDCVPFPPINCDQGYQFTPMQFDTFLEHRLLLDSTAATTSTTATAVRRSERGRTLAGRGQIPDQRVALSRRPHLLHALGA